MRKTLLTLTTLVLMLPAAAQELATTVRSIEVVPGIYMLEGVDGFSSNMGLLVGDDHVLLIDDGMSPITASLMATVQELAGRPADFVVNTHAHGDHVGSNATLADNGAVIFAHDNLRKRLAEKPEDAGGPAGLCRLARLIPYRQLCAGIGHWKGRWAGRRVELYWDRGRGRVGGWAW